MTSEAQRILIAEACGWKHYKNTGVDGWWPPYVLKIENGNPNYGDLVGQCPDYLNDLNAIREAVDTLSFDERTEWLRALVFIVHGVHSDTLQTDAEWTAVANAKASQVAEAFCHAKGLWKD